MVIRHAIYQHNHVIEMTIAEKVLRSVIPMCQRDTRLDVSIVGGYETRELRSYSKTSTKLVDLNVRISEHTEVTTL